MSPSFLSILQNLWRFSSNVCPVVSLPLLTILVSTLKYYVQNVLFFCTFSPALCLVSYQYRVSCGDAQCPKCINAHHIIIKHHREERHSSIKQPANSNIAYYSILLRFSTQSESREFLWREGSISIPAAV